MRQGDTRKVRIVQVLSITQLLGANKIKSQSWSKYMKATANFEDSLNLNL